MERQPSQPSEASAPAPSMTAVGTLVVGIGNPTRGDDAVGWHLVERVAALELSGVEVQSAQQLHPEMAEHWSRFARVMVLDAAATGPGVDLRPLGAEEIRQAESLASHHLSPAAVAALACQLYGHRPEVWLCAVRAESIDFSEQLTSRMRERVEIAWTQLRVWLGAAGAK